jgi:hypothetical protein
LTEKIYVAAQNLGNEGRGKREEGRGKGEEGRGKREVGSGKREVGRGIREATQDVHAKKSEGPKRTPPILMTQESEVRQSWTASRI